VNSPVAIEKHVSLHGCLTPGGPDEMPYSRSLPVEDPRLCDFEVSPQAQSKSACDANQFSAAQKRGMTLPESGDIRSAVSAQLSDVIEFQDHAVALIFAGSGEFRIVAVSEGYIRQTGASREQLVGSSLFGFFPVDIEGLRASLERVQKTGAPDQMEPRQYETDGVRRYRKVIHSPVRGEGGRVEFILHSIEFISERVATERRERQAIEILLRNEERQQMMLKLLADQRKSSNPDEMMAIASEGVARYLKADRVGFFEMDEDVVVFRACFASGRLPLLTGTMAPSEVGTGYLAEILAGKTTAVSDARTSPLTADSRFGEIGTVSLIGVPIMRNGRWHGGLYVNHPEVREWTSEEVALAQEVGEQTWDAVERARAEHALRQSEERLSFALDAGGGVGTWDWDIPGNRFYAGGNFARIFSLGMNNGSLPDTPLETFVKGVAPADRARVEKSLREAVRSGGDFAEEFRLMESEGTPRWVYAKGRCHLDENGKPLRFPGVAFDITARKEGEAHLHHQFRVFDTVLSHTPDFTYIFNLNGRFTYINKALLDLLQISYDDALGKNFFDLGYPPALAVRLQSQIQDVIETRRTVRDTTPFTGPDGEERYYEYIFVPVFAQDGSVDAVAGTTHEITEQMRTEAELRRMNRELEEFAYVASHDLREPLRMVNIYTELILADVNQSDRVKSMYSDFVRQGVQRMETLIRDLLTFSRTIQKDDREVRGTADLSEALSQALTLLDDRIKAAGALIVTDDLPAVYGDTGQLAHVFQNLISNALKYSRADVIPEIGITFTRDGNRCEVAFRDNGIGFEPQYADGIFGLFKRLHTSAYPGTGLGLAICRRILERYDGTIRAEGRLGEGATFYFSLAIAEPQGLSAAV
jgi:PAS domain S-box-containing protein